MWASSACCFVVVVFLSGLHPYAIFICIGFTQAALSNQLRGSINCGTVGCILKVAFPMVLRKIAENN